MKTCIVCGEMKPLDDFHRQASKKDGRFPYCKPCARERTREYRAGLGDEYRRRRKANYHANRDENRKKARERYRKRPELTREAAWRAQGITSFTWDDYRKLLAHQGGGCAICGKSEGENGKSLAVDHDHDTDAVRGLLCDDCNIALGRFRDSPELLRRAISYLDPQKEDSPWR